MQASCKLTAYEAPDMCTAPRRYYSLNDTVDQAFKQDMVRRFDLDLVPLLEDGVRVMLYNGACARLCLESFTAVQSPLAACSCNVKG